MAWVQLWQFRICVTSFWEFYSENHQALKSRLTWSVLLQLSTKPEQPGWLRLKSLPYGVRKQIFNSLNPSQNVLTPLLSFTSLVLSLCLNAWVLNQQSSVCVLSGYSGSAGCFLQPRGRRLQPDTAPPPPGWWRVARGGAGSVRQRVHPAARRRRRETRGHRLAGPESRDHYWPLRCDAWKLFPLGTQPELPR